MNNSLSRKPYSSNNTMTSSAWLPASCSPKTQHIWQSTGLEYQPHAVLAVLLYHQEGIVWDCGEDDQEGRPDCAPLPAKELPVFPSSHGRTGPSFPASERSVHTARGSRE